MNLEGHFYLLWIHAVTIILGGILTAGRKSNRTGSWYELASAYAVGVVYLALAGWLCIALGRSTYLAIVFAILVPALFCLKWWRGGAKKRLFGWMAHEDLLAFGLWVLFLHGTFFLATQPIAFPKNIPDGIFIDKESTLHTRIQFISGPLPADNYIPFAVAECLLRDVSFPQNQMILPGQIVTDRTFLMSFFYLPFRMASGDIPPAMPLLPRFGYVGTQWPNTWIFDKEEIFTEFLAAGIFLNGLLLIGAMALAEYLYDRSICWMCMLLLSVTPYTISQTMFTWPKTAIGFFIILAGIEAFANKRFAISGLYAGVAYHCHPCAVFFIFGIVMGILYDAITSKWTATSGWWPLLRYLGACLMVMLPWLVWKDCIVKLPSDLFQQNFNLNGTVEQQIWIRIYNFIHLFVSPSFENPGYSEPSIITGYNYSLIFSVGIFLIIPALWEACVICCKKVPMALCTLFLPSLLIVAFFCTGALSIVHGLQLFVAVLVVLGVARLRQEMKKGILIVIGAQVLLHLFFIGWRMEFLQHGSLM